MEVQKAREPTQITGPRTRVALFLSAEAVMKSEVLGAVPRGFALAPYSVGADAVINHTGDVDAQKALHAEDFIWTANSRGFSEGIWPMIVSRDGRHYAFRSTTTIENHPSYTARMLLMREEDRAALNAEYEKTDLFRELHPSDTNWIFHKHDRRE